MSSTTSASARLPKKVRVLLLGNLFSAIGNGLVLPYFFIYLHNVRGISSAIAGVVIGYGAFASLLVSPLAGSLIDHWGPKPILVGSLVVSAIGYASLSLVHSVVQAVIAISISSIGQSAMWPAQNAIQTELTPIEIRQRIYGANFAALNLGIGIGGAISSLVVSISHPRSFEALYIGDGLSFILYAAIVLTLGNAGNRSIEERAINSERESGWRDVLADKTFVKFWILCLFAIICGYSQLEVGFASFSTLVAHLPASNIAYAYTVNCFLIASGQLWVVKRTENWRRGRALATATVIWLFAWVALSLAGVDKSHALFFIILCQAIFGVGEMVWSPLIPSVVNQLAPDHLRGRYNAASSNAWQFALIVGPMIAGTLLGAGLHWLWTGGLIVGLGAISLVALRLKLPELKQP